MADPVPAEEKQDDLADALIDALTDYRCFRHEIDNFDDDDLADLKKHLAEAANPALRAARENALEEAAASADAEADRLDAKADESEANGEDLMGDQQSFAAFILRNRAARIRSLKSPSSASTKGEGNG